MQGMNADIQDIPFSIYKFYGFLFLAFYIDFVLDLRNDLFRGQYVLHSLQFQGWSTPLAVWIAFSQNHFLI